MHTARYLLEKLSPIAAVPMPDWILSDHLQTDPVACRHYVDHAMQGGGVFTHQSEHMSLQITSPDMALRISHGKVYQLAMRDPTDMFDLPDHTTFQHNLEFEQIRFGSDPRGILGETVAPVLDEDSQPIISGPSAFRGTEDDYRVSGPFANDFRRLQTASR